MLRLYTKNDCPYCDVMKEKLAEWGVPYSTINVSINPIGLQYLKDAGFRTVPQLMIEDTSLNDGIDTREFTLTDLHVRLEIYIIKNKDKSWADLGPDVIAWANKTLKARNESKSV